MIGNNPLWDDAAPQGRPMSGEYRLTDEQRARLVPWFTCDMSKDYWPNGDDADLIAVVESIVSEVEAKVRADIAAEIEACVEVRGDAPWSVAFVHGMTVAANIARGGGDRG